jgi:hypothetical protein
MAVLARWRGKQMIRIVVLTICLLFCGCTSSGRAIDVRTVRIVNIYNLKPVKGSTLADVAMEHDGKHYALTVVLEGWHTETVMPRRDEMWQVEFYGDQPYRFVGKAQ